MAILSPPRGATVSGTVRWSATARPRPRRVEFRVDGRLLRIDRTAPYVYRWDSRRVRNGYHRLSVRAVWRVRLTTTSLTARRWIKTLPASFYTGPLGQNNILPAKTPGALLGLWPSGWNGSTWDEQKTLLLSREAYIGRRFDMVHLHYAAPHDGCYYDAPLSDARAQWVRDNGYKLVVSWTPGWTIDEINAGKADACFRDVGQRFAAWGTRFLLRIYWEFNSGDPYWAGWGQPFIDAWKRTVDVIRSQGATAVGFLWSPDGGYQSRTAVSYPGDNYVDWVGVSAYNPNATWCSPFNPGPWCDLAEQLSFTFLNDPTFWTVYDRYSQSKPFMLAEWGSVEDPTTPGRKGQWFRNFKAKLPEFPNIRAFTYVDVDLTGAERFNWRLDTSQSSLDGFRDLALDPLVNVDQ